MFWTVIALAASFSICFHSTSQILRNEINYLHSKNGQKLQRSGKTLSCCRTFKVFRNENGYLASSLWDSYFYNCSKYHISEVPGLMSELVIKNYTGYDVNCSKCDLDQVPQEIPGIPSNEIIRLNLACNHLTRLTSNIFSNFTSLVSLDISSNKMQHVSNESFLGLTNLQVLQMAGSNTGGSFLHITSPGTLFTMLPRLLVLDVSNNLRKGFIFDELILALCEVSSSLEVLVMNRIHGSKFVPWMLDKHFYGCLNHTKLKVLSLERNAIVGMVDIQVSIFPYIRWLSVRRNSIVAYQPTAFLVLTIQNLTCFDIGCQKIGSDWIDCNPQNNPTSVGTNSLNARNMVTSNNYIKDQSGKQNICPTSRPKLYIETLKKLRYVRMDYIDIGSGMNFNNPPFCLRNNSLEHLDVSYSKLLEMNGTAWCMDKLKYINARGTQADFLDSKLFCQMPRLQTLILANSAAAETFQDSQASVMFHHNQDLSYLDLSNNNLKNLPPNIFEFSRKLQNINLNHNQFSQLLFNIKHLNSLKTIDLRWNQIQSFTFSEKFLFQLHSLAIKQNNISLLLRNNPLTCSCAERRYLEMLSHPKISIPGWSDGSLKCLYENGTSLSIKAASTMLNVQCMTDYKLIYLLYAITVTLEMLIAIICRLFYFYLI